MPATRAASKSAAKPKPQARAAAKSSPKTAKKSSPKKSSKPKHARESGTIQTKDGVQLAFESVGSGPAIVLVDGAFCSRDVGPMPKLAELLAPKFKVYLYDRRGRNESTDKAPYSVTKEIEDLRAVMAQAGGRAHVVGMSSGSVLALRAAMAGVPMESMSLYEPPFIVPPNPDPIPPDHRERLQELLAANRRADAVAYYMVKVIGMPEGYLAPMKRMKVWDKLQAAAHTLPYDSSVMGDFRVPADLKRVKVPTMVMCGERSAKLLRDATAAVASTMPDAKAVTLPKQGHAVSPKAFAPYILEFLGA